MTNQHGLILTGSGTSWAAIEAPLPANADISMGANISAAACAPASACVVVGVYAGASSNPHGLLVTGSGTSWTATEAPLPASATSQADPNLYAVACPSASSCVVAGDYGDSGASYGLLISGAGTSWTATEAPQPANAATIAILRTVACASATACTAAGWYRDSSGSIGRC